jgi:hypothetical protein
MEIYTKTDDENPDVEILLQDFTMYGITVPKGFAFDGASAPRMFWGIIPPFKRTKKAACIHDWLCVNAKSKEDRKEADKIFYRALEDAGLNKARCTIGYIGVRIGAHLGIGVHY